MKRIKYEGPVIKSAVCRSYRVVMASLNGGGENFSGDVSGAWDGSNNSEGFTEETGSWE